MTARAAGPMRSATPWLLVGGVLVVTTVVLVVEHAGASVSAAGTTELSKDLINASGLLLAFTGIIFTGMLAEIRFRTERAVQAEDAGRQQHLERTSVVLRRSAFASFVFFAAALAVAIGNLAASVQSPSGTFQMTTVFVAPSILAFGGIASLVVALALLAT